MSTHRKYFTHLALIGFLGGAVYAATLFLSEHSVAYDGSDFVLVENGAEFAFDGDTNVLIGSFQLPDPVADTVLVDGATGDPVAGDALSSFSEGELLLDTNNDGNFDGGEGIFSASLPPGPLGSSDVVLTTATNVLSSFSTVEGSDLYMYLEQGVVESTFENGEDIYKLLYNGAEGDATNSVGIHNFDATEAFLDGDSDDVLDVDAINDYGEAIIRDGDENLGLSASDTVTAPGTAKIVAVEAADKLCFDESGGEAGDYDTGDVIWMDIAGNCTTFDASTDVVIVGIGEPGPASTLFGTEQEIGINDVNGNGAFTCTRGGACEAVVYSGTNGENLTNNAVLSSLASFFDSSTYNPDGIGFNGTAWDEADGPSIVTSFDTGVGEHVYLDQNGAGWYSEGEDIFWLVLPGATDAAVTGQPINTFDANEKLLFLSGESVYNGDNAVFVRSANADLDVGALDGSGTDQVVLGAGGVLITFTDAKDRYFDANSDLAFDAGDDVVNDADGSDFYNADDLQTLMVGTSGDASDITDDNLSAVYVYEMTGATCEGAGTDTLLGSLGAAPFLNTNITVTKDPYLATDSDASKTLCVYADIGSGSHGKVWYLTIPDEGAQFTSGDAPIDGAEIITNVATVFVARLPASLTAASSRADRVTSYSFVIQGAEVEPSGIGSSYAVIFPDGYDVSSATIACQAQSEPADGTFSILGQEAIFTFTADPLDDVEVECTIATVRNPDNAGETGTFVIVSRNADDVATGVDNDETVAIRAASSGGGGGGGGSVSYDISLASPNGGEEFDALSTQTVTWTSTGAAMGYVDIGYSIDGGLTFVTIEQDVANDGSYNWLVPDISSDEVMLRLQGTDLSSTLATDTSDASFTISAEDEMSIAPSSGETGINPLTGEEEAVSEVEAGQYVKGASSSTVYYVDINNIRHPFPDAQTYFTYEWDFDDLVEVTEATLPTLPLGEPMLVKPEIILVKLASDPRVYAVAESADGETVLRLISGEELAASLYGDYWADYVIDIPDAFWPRYLLGDDMTGSESVDIDAMKTRIDVLAGMDTDGDGLSDGEEIMYGSNASLTDTDGDGFNDETEVEHGYSPVLFAPARL